MAQEVKRQTSNSSASALGWGTWPTASTECASREVSGGFSVGQASRPPVWAFKRSMGNGLNPSAEFGRWLTAFLWDGAGACTLHRKPYLQRVSSVGLLSKSVLLTDRGQSAVLKPRSKGVTSHDVYVDNFGIQSLEEQAAKEGLDAVTTAFEEKHLKVHETEVQCEKTLPWESCWTEECWKHGLGKFDFVESDPPLELPFEGDECQGASSKFFSVIAPTWPW